MVEICTSPKMSNSGIWANFNFFGNCLSSTYHLQCTLLVPEDIETGLARGGGGGGGLFVFFCSYFICKPNTCIQTGAPQVVNLPNQSWNDSMNDENELIVT